MISFFKKLFCNCEVDMTNFEAPICIKCGTEIPRCMDNSTPFFPFGGRMFYNPKLEKWRSRHIAKKTSKIFQEMKK